MNKITKYDPFSQLETLQQQFFGDDLLSAFKGGNIPTTDVYIKDNTLVVEAHLPHFKDENVDITIDNGDLIIQASRHEQDEDKNKKYVVRESSSNFYRRIHLPERSDVETIEADFDEGVLHVKVPLTPLPEPKKISITKSNKKKN